MHPDSLDQIDQRQIDKRITEEITLRAFLIERIEGICGTMEMPYHLCPTEALIAIYDNLKK
jgi:hypothetical protein